VLKINDHRLTDIKLRIMKNYEFDYEMYPDAISEEVLENVKKV